MRRLPSMLAVALVASGCATLSQPGDRVLVREPGHRAYSPPQAVRQSARAHWEYAVLSENAYHAIPRVLALPEATPEAYGRRCVPDDPGPLPLPGWRIWPDFPSQSLREEAGRVGLFVQVWEKDAEPPVVAVVFRGTEFTSWKDWISNLRWFLRFIPLYEDQYTLVSRRVGQELVERLVRRRAEVGGGPQALRIVATGHSLGGGLAQHLAYSLPPASKAGVAVPRISYVYAFDPSPVTGWFSVEEDLREPNAAGLGIDRVFEHGEILAYIRLILSYVNPPSAANPSVREVRYNFVPSVNPFSSHSMRLLACALIDASGQAAIPDLLERFRGK